MRVRFSFGFGNSSCWFGLIALGIFVAAGCEQTSETDLTIGNHQRSLSRKPQCPMSQDLSIDSNRA